jgi:hypothetical protein
MSSYVFTCTDDLCELAKRDLLRLSKPMKLYTVNTDNNSFNPLQRALLSPHVENETINVKMISAEELPQVLQFSQRHGAGIKIKNYAKIYWALISMSILITDDRALIKVANYYHLTCNSIEWYINMVVDSKLTLNLNEMNIRKE